MHQCAASPHFTLRTIFLLRLKQRLPFLHMPEIIPKTLYNLLILRLYGLILDITKACAMREG
jgi:hypothetical protein